MSFSHRERMNPVQLTEGIRVGLHLRGGESNGQLTGTWCDPSGVGGGN